MDAVKYQFFSEKNNKFIFDILNKKGNGDVLNKNTIFQIQNTIFNTFLESVYNKDISVTNSNIEEILISLNKMTIIQCEKNATQPSPSLQTLVPISTSTSTQTHAMVLLKNTQVQTEEMKETKMKELKELKELEELEEIEETEETEELEEMKMKEMKMKEIKVKEPTLLHVFSDSPFVKYDKLKLKSFCLYFNLYNINENNNLFELKIDTTSTKIYIPIGHYDLKTLLVTIETSISSKISTGSFKMIHDPHRNRIKISNSSHFNLHFIDSPKAILNLRTILGFTNTHYMNNHYYITEGEHKLDLFDTIYVRSDVCEPNILTNSEFNYLFKLQFDSSKHARINFDIDCSVFLKERKIAFQFYIYIKEFKQINQHIEYDALFSVI